ncbi:MAG: hypothetical protein GX046_01345 [Tissierellia bacterium]|nr:hypothetical protein [Tissierellia bacterium]
MSKVLRLGSQRYKKLTDLGAVLKEPFDSCGLLEIGLSSDYFVSISPAIVGQQLSNKVTKVIWDRVESLMYAETTAEKMLNSKDEKLREMGVSYSKIS